MTQGLGQASELSFTKLAAAASISALGGGDRWTVTAPDGSRLLTVIEPLLSNPARRVWQAMSQTYPVADRYHWLEFQAEPEVPVLILDKLPASKKHAFVRLPGGENLGQLLFSPSRIVVGKVCLRMRDAAGASLGEILRVHSPEFPGGLLNYAVHGASGARIATVDGAPARVDHFRGSYRLNITAPLPESLYKLVVAAALACPYMRV